MLEYAERKKENPLIQIGSMHTAMLQTARHLTTEVQRGTRQIKQRIGEK
jgi:hypothetical protein